MMLHLLTPSPVAWLPVALADVDELMLDHAHCEMKAVASANSFAEKYPTDPAFVADMRALAAEEETHYVEVRKLLDQKGVVWRKAKSDLYVKHLLKVVRPPEQLRKLDRLLIASIIEARSCERLGLLAGGFQEPALKAFYRELFESEARHHGLFLEWARHFAGRQAADERMLELVRHETDYVLNKLPTPHVHG